MRWLCSAVSPGTSWKDSPRFPAPPSYWENKEICKARLPDRVLMIWTIASGVFRNITKSDGLPGGKSAGKAAGKPGPPKHSGLASWNAEPSSIKAKFLRQDPFSAGDSEHAQSSRCQTDPSHPSSLPHSTLSSSWSSKFMNLWIAAHLTGLPRGKGQLCKE